MSDTPDCHIPTNAYQVFSRAIVLGVAILASPNTMLAQGQCQWTARVQQAMIQSLQGVPEDACKILSLAPEAFNTQHKQLEQNLISGGKLIEGPLTGQLQVIADKYKPGSESVLLQDDLTPNAFATGQYVVFTSGLVEWYLNPTTYLMKLGMNGQQAAQYLSRLPITSPGVEGLEAVLAHETSHNLLGHPNLYPVTNLCTKYIDVSIKDIEKYKKTGKQSGGSGALLKKTFSGFLGTFQASQEQQQYESQADRLGAWLVFRETGDPQGMAKTLQWLSLVPLDMVPSTRGQAIQEALCSDHPNLLSRVSQVQQLGYSLNPAQPPADVASAPRDAVVARYEQFVTWRSNQLGTESKDIRIALVNSSAPTAEIIPALEGNCNKETTGVFGGQTLSAIHAVLSSSQDNADYLLKATVETSTNDAFRLVLYNRSSQALLYSPVPDEPPNQDLDDLMKSVCVRIKLDSIRRAKGLAPLPPLAP